MTLTTEVKELVTSTKAETGILSIYLSVDQQRAGNLNRGYQVTFKNLLREAGEGVEPDEAAAFERAVNCAQHYMAEYVPEGKTLVLFCSGDGEILWQQNLRVPIDSQAYWQENAFIRPLMEAHDEFQRYAVVVTDRARARLFTVMLNEIEENQEALAEWNVRKFDSSTRDRMRSQMNFQRQADEHARRHLRNVADMMDKLADEQAFDRLVLAGVGEAVKDLEKMLSERLKSRYMGSISLPVDAPENAVLEKTRARAEETERRVELDLVQRLITASAKETTGVLGLAATLSMAVTGRIDTLVYSQNFLADPKSLKRARDIMDASDEAGPREESTRDVLEWLIERVVRSGGAIEQVRGDAAEKLNAEGEGMGAFLRY